jgi:Exocyst complex component SEC3 N-terminal PIP2 binding PH
MNSNGTFSVGKTWKLNELRAVEVINVSCAFVSWSRYLLTPIQPSTVNITLARTYRWQTEESSEQLEFLQILVDLFRSVSGGTLQVIGLPEPGIDSGEVHFCSHVIAAHHSQPYHRSPRIALLVSRVLLPLPLLHRGHLKPDVPGTPYPGI